MHLEGEEADRLVLLPELVLLVPTKRVLGLSDPESRRAAGLFLTAMKARPFEREAADRVVL